MQKSQNPPEKLVHIIEDIFVEIDEIQSVKDKTNFIVKSTLQQIRLARDNRPHDKYLIEHHQHDLNKIIQQLYIRTNSSKYQNSKDTHASNSYHSILDDVRIQFLKLQKELTTINQAGFLSKKATCKNYNPSNPYEEFTNPIHADVKTPCTNPSTIEKQCKDCNNYLHLLEQPKQIEQK